MKFFCCVVNTVKTVWAEQTFCKLSLVRGTQCWKLRSTITCKCEICYNICCLIIGSFSTILQVGSAAEWCRASFLQRQDWWFNSHPSLVVLSWLRCFTTIITARWNLTSSKLKKAGAKFKRKNSETKDGASVQCIRPMHSVSVAFSWLEEKMKKSKLITFSFAITSLC